MLNLFKKKKQAPVYAPKTTFNQNIANFWRWFKANETSLSAVFDGKEIDYDVATEVREAVNRMVDGMSWCFGPALDKTGHSLSMSPEGDGHELLLSMQWRDLAPKIDRWEFYPSKKGGDVKEHSLSMFDHSFKFDEMLIELKPNEERQKPDIKVFHPHFKELEENNRITVTFIMLDEALGELETGAWLGKVEAITELPERYTTMADLEENLYQLYQSLEWKQQDPEAVWVSFSLQKQDETLPFKQADSISKTTMAESLFYDYMDDPNNFEDPLMPHGAAYVFLAIPTGHFTPGNEVYERGDIEDRYTEVLEESKNSRHIGAGMGTVYTYIDFVIYNGQESIDEILNIAKEQNLPAGTSLQFFDKNFKDVKYLLN